MSPIIINSTTSNVTSSLSTAKIANCRFFNRFVFLVIKAKLGLLPVSSKNAPQSDIELDMNQEGAKDNDDTEIAREERKATGRSVAIVIFLCLMCLAIYHVIQRKTTILAGVRQGKSV